MTNANIQYFKLQAKKLYKDFETKKPYFDEVASGVLYEYTPKYFDIDTVVLSYDIDEENFTLMKAQHIIACMVGFLKWDNLIKASKAELDLARLVFDNQHKIGWEEWEMYIGEVCYENKTYFGIEDQIEIFKKVFVERDGHASILGDFRLKKGS
ncbi:MAG: hypothetical protein N4A44_04655 [Alphaproteobacteria bacterium]|jgi:hypothetical protein|nr:hypothetical protein [Alphaproteobacteria bacterium]